MLFRQTNLDKMLEALNKAGVNPIKDDYIIVIGPEVWSYDLCSPIQIVEDSKAPKGSAYCMRRADYKPSLKLEATE